MTTFSRSFPLEDITIQRGGDGRTVEAYAAVFDTPAEVRDGQGHYIEQIGRAAFNKTIADNGNRFGVFYNHGMTLHGTPSDIASVPLGTPMEVRADSRGLLTVTRYNKTPLAEQVLESIKNGDIRGQSFTGRIVRSDVPTPPRGFRPARSGDLPVVTRTEIALREYGPTPFPVYSDAEILGVRSLVASLHGLSDDEREQVRALLLATPQEPAIDAPTSVEDAGTEEPQMHSGRQTPSITSLRWKARQKGVL